MDILDIVLVALLLFYLYRLMRASSSANIFTGVLVFIVVWILVSQVLEMRLLGGIFDRMVNVGSARPHRFVSGEIRHFFSPSAPSVPRACSNGCDALRKKSVSRTHHAHRARLHGDGASKVEHSSW